MTSETDKESAISADVDESSLGAGAVVTKNVPDYALIVGVPSKQIGWVSEAGVRLKFDDKNEAFCEKSKKKYKLENDQVIELN